MGLSLIHTATVLSLQNSIFFTHIHEDRRMSDQTSSLHQGSPPEPAPATAGLGSTPHAVITELSDSEDERTAGGAADVAPTASTSAVSLDTPATSTEGVSVLRERVRSPYSGQRDTSSASAVANGRSSGDTTDSKGKGKERETVSDESSTAPDPEDAVPGNASAFACHICLEVPRSDDAVLTRCGHLYCCESRGADGYERPVPELVCLLLPYCRDGPVRMARLESSDHLALRRLQVANQGHSTRRDPDIRRRRRRVWYKSGSGPSQAASTQAQGSPGSCVTEPRRVLGPIRARCNGSSRVERPGRHVPVPRPCLWVVESADTGSWRADACRYDAVAAGRHAGRGTCAGSCAAEEQSYRICGHDSPLLVT